MKAHELYEVYHTILTGVKHNFCIITYLLGHGSRIKVGVPVSWDHLKYFINLNKTNPVNSDEKD